MRLTKPLFVAGLAALAAWQTSARVGQDPDSLCRMLFDEYIVAQGKIDGSTKTAALHIVAERGRASGFWRDVLAALRANDDRHERDCVRLLGRMLELDAEAREAARVGASRPGATQGLHPVFLAADVAEELLSRARRADRSRADLYSVALARARLPEARVFFDRVLADVEGDDHLPSTKFHAAVGLAQLGDARGFDWLIEHGGEVTPTISNAWPARRLDLNLGANCVAALQQLSGRAGLRSKQEWDAWWASIDREAVPRGVVRFDEM